MKINFCSQCGSDKIEYRVPEDDNRPRFICNHCNFTHYQNPNIVAGCLVTQGDKILFCKRAIQPRKGAWTLPGGFMENHESVAQAAQRETWEEAQARVKLYGLYTMFNLPHISQVFMIYRGELLDNSYGPGPESLKVELRGINDIPWDELAFPTIRETLRLYVKDIERGEFGLHCADIIRPWVMVNARNAWLANLQTK